MPAFLFKLINMSVTASWLVLAVIVLRLILKKAPKSIRCALWALVGIRLVIPFSVKSVLSLIPSSEPIIQDTLFLPLTTLNGTSAVKLPENTVVYDPSLEASSEAASSGVGVGSVLFFIWLTGVVLMLIYTAVSYIILLRKTRESAVREKGIFLCDKIDSPFILGVIRPRIYLPFGMEEDDAEYVIAHEKAHLRRFDHLWKPLGFLILCVYWFNPVIWIGYILLCRDIELACDEKVIRELGVEIKKPYSEALINCSLPRYRISACPLAFGEVGVEKRVKSVLNYKKPAFWIIILAVVISAVAAVCLLTDPKQKDKNVEQTGYSDIEGVSIRITDIERAAPSPYIEVEWKNESGKDIVYGESFYVYRDDNGNWVDCNEMSDVVHLIGYLLPDGKTAIKRYSLSYMKMEKGGLYRFDTDCHIDGGEAGEEYKLWIDFQLEKPIEGINIRQLDAENWACRPRSWDYFDVAEEPSLPLFRVVNEKHFLIWEDGNWQPCGDLEKTKLTEEIWDDEFEEGVWIRENSAKKLRLNNKNVWIADRGEQSEYTHIFYMLLEQDNGRWYVARGDFNSEKGHSLSEVYAVEEKEPYTPEHSYDEMIPGESSESAKFDIDGDGVDEICRKYYCPELENLSFILTVTEEDESGVVYEYMSVFECTGAGNIKFAEVDGRICLMSTVEVEPDPPLSDRSEVIKTYWEIGIDENRNLRLTTDGGKTVMKSYSANNVILNNYGDIIYAGSNQTSSGDTHTYVSNGVIGVPMNGDDLDTLDFSEHQYHFSILQVKEQKYLMIYEDEEWIKFGDLKETELTEKIWENELKGIEWIGDNSAESVRKNNEKAWIAEGKESDGFHYYCILLEQKDGNFYLARGDYSDASGYRIFSVEPLAEILAENLNKHYGYEYATERYDIDGDGAVELCTLHLCPKLDDFSFMLSVIEENSPKSSYDYSGVFRCKDSDQVIFIEMDGRLYIQTHDPGHPDFAYDDVYTFWNIETDTDGRLQLRSVDDKRLMARYESGHLAFTNTRDIVYIENPVY